MSSSGGAECVKSRGKRARKDRVAASQPDEYEFCFASAIFHCRRDTPLNSGEHIANMFERNVSFETLDEMSSEIWRLPAKSRDE